MLPFVLDASLTLSWCFEDEATPYSRNILLALKETHAAVPALWPFEIANALASAERSQRITPAGIETFLGALQRLPIQIERRDASSLWQAVLPIARQSRLSAYDAAYLELARREKMPLAALDQDLRKVCVALGVPLVDVSTT